ncbi:transposase [Microcoleus sp. T3_B1]|uniref:transposase n=1 Tax=Microcoleus sp. T3_B1 TaxID=3055425 RepID=UPI002FD4CE97
MGCWRLLLQLWVGAIVGMDNLPVYNAEAVNFLMVSIGAKVKFLPRYSPDLSPIELSWAKIKAIFPSQAYPPSNVLDEAITKAINAFTDENAWPSFHHSGLF